MKENFSQALRKSTVTDEKGTVLVSDQLWKIILEKLEYGEVLASHIKATQRSIPIEVDMGIRKILRGE